MIFSNGRGQGGGKGETLTITKRETRQLKASSFSINDSSL